MDSSRARGAFVCLGVTLCLVLAGRRAAVAESADAEDSTPIVGAAQAASPEVLATPKVESSPFKEENDSPKVNAPTATKRLPPVVNDELPPPRSGQNPLKIFDQPPPTVEPEATCGTGCDADCGTSAPCCDGFCGVPGRIWFRAEYLHWRTRGQRLPALAATATDLTDLQTLQATTVVEFGDKDYQDGDHEGFHATIGAWLDRCHQWGLEGDYFELESRRDDFDSGLSNGFPVLFRPIYDRNGVGPEFVSVPLANNFGIPGLTGSVTIQTQDYFQSAGLTLRRQLWGSEWSSSCEDVNWLDRHARSIRVDGLVGYRYYGLNDSVGIREQRVDTAFGGTLDSSADSFSAANSFQGIDLGTDTIFGHGRWSLQIISKLAVGMNHQTVNINGQTTIIDPLGNAFVAPGGRLAQPANGLGYPGNIGDYGRSRFAAIPHLSANVGYQITERWKAFAGYEIVYWNEVVRAGGAIDNTVDTPRTLGGQARPAFSWNTTSYWAQGLTLGSEVRF